MTAEANTASRPRIVIVGAGFGGLELAKALRAAPVEILLIDRHNYHTFQPLLYQVATAALEPEEIAHAVRGIFQKQANLRFRMATVTGVDWDAQEIHLAEGGPERFDYLVLAAGAVTKTFGIPGIEQHAFALKELTEAVDLRSHIIRRFERVSEDPAQLAQGALNVVLVGGGPTGVEMAGAFVELFALLQKDFPHLDVSRARILLVEAGPALLAAFDESLQAYTLATLRQRGVEVLLNRSVTAVEADAVHLDGDERIAAQTVLWAAGVKASPLADALGLAQTHGGRIVVEQDLSVPGRPHVFVIGDLAGSMDEEGQLYPQLAPVAMQGGKHVARAILARLNGEESGPFVYKDKGTMATIGRNAAVAQLPMGLKLTGFLAWQAWAWLHLLLLVGFRNRVNVYVNWVWNYFTYDRSARLITNGGHREPAQLTEHANDSPDRRDR